MLSLRQIRLGFGGPWLLDGVDLEIRTDERICLLGRNGAGKSSLLKVIAGLLPADAGERWAREHLRVAFLGQETSHAFNAPVTAVLREALDASGIPDWEIDARMERVLTALGLDGAANADTLSVGMRRRVVLATCLAREPDLLVLDEPTNHLDLIAIAWLEEFLPKFRGSVIFTTHDRAFMRTLATRILDLDRGQLTSYDCDYATYIQRKEVQLETEAVQAAALDRKLGREEAWIRQGVRARRTRNEGRVRALHRLREEQRQRRARSGNVRLEIEQAERSGTKVIVAEDLAFSYDGEQDVLHGFSALICRGDRVGIVGPNGAGKTTLIKLLLGKLKPTAGALVQGTNLQVAYFDQTRETLPEDAAVADCIADGAMDFDWQGGRRNVIRYLRDFLFTADRARSPVKSLSGGERNRLLLARLFTRPFNLLVMDEPTNDLDLETLELLEDLLLDFPGTLLLVSHDRAFLNHIATSLIVLDGSGGVDWVQGDYDDYLRQCAERKAASSPTAAAGRGTDRKATDRPRTRPRGFLNRERRELEALPAEIEALEAETEAIANRFGRDGGGPDAAAMHARLREVEAEIGCKYARWEALETLRQELGDPQPGGAGSKPTPP